MLRSPDSSVRLLRRLRGAVALIALAATCLPPLAATPPAVRLPLLSRLGKALFPPNDPGYLPSVGAAELRLRETPGALPIKAPPVTLYAVPEPPAATASSGASGEAGTVKQPSSAEAPPAVTLSDRKPPPLRPEDFLPYFQLNDGTSRGAPAEGVQFTPARPELPNSQADYRQQ
jgi:hypothetical protein